MNNDSDLDYSRYLRSSFTTMQADEVLRASPAVLIGVGSSAAAALTFLQISSVFDLASSRIFAAAAALTTISLDPSTVEARLNIIANDIAQMPPGVPVGQLADQSITILRGVDDNTAPALDVATVRDLALWPPYLAAKEILKIAFFPETEPGFDPDAPADLLPKSGIYPTERIFFKKLVIDTLTGPGEGAQPIENAPPIDLSAALSAPIGFTHLATGALLTFSQSWFAQGLTLGQLLHSTSLAPGESTRIAVIDWSRRNEAVASEVISEDELLSNAMTHSRALSEVTSATASEFQSGRSSVHSNSTTAQDGAGFGMDLGLVSIGGSGGISNTTTDVMSASSSFGARDMAANYAQDINDRSQQNASSVRNRRASIVRENTQSESENATGRMLTNYNHMHALSIHYYEVIQAFRTTTQLERAEKCLFVPIKLVDFQDNALVDRWRLVLAASALTERARRQLTVEYGVVEIIPQTPRIRPGNVLAGNIVRPGLMTMMAQSVATTSPVTAPTATAPNAGATDNTNASVAPSDPDSSAGTTHPLPTNGQTNIDYQLAPANSPAGLLALKGWDIEQLNRIGWATNRVLMQPGSDSAFVSDDALLVGLSLREGQAARFSIRLHTGQEVAPAAVTPTSFLFVAPVSITDLDSIGVQFVGQQNLTTALILQLNLSGTIMPLDVPILLKPMSVPNEVVRFGGVQSARELIDHLNANRLHYSQAILRALDVATVAALLSRFTYRSLPLGQLVDPQPVAIMANFLVFKMNIASGVEAEDPRWVEEQKSWQQWLEQRGLDLPAPKTEIIPIPSGGVFAEAVLGRYNAAEKTDLTRFWNWLDSPIPLVAPEIAPIQTGSRAQSDQITPGQLGAPVLGIQTPTALPDATGIAAIINAVQNGNMFRDMSGLIQSAAVAQSAIQASAAGATAVGEQAAQNLKEVMDARTERMRIAASVLTGGAAGLGGGGSSAGGRPAKNVTEEGARLNFAKSLDANKASSSTASGGSGGAAKNSGGVANLPSPQTEASSSVTQPESTTEDLFNRQTGGLAADLINQATDTSSDLVGTENLLALASPGGGGSGTSGIDTVEPFPAQYTLPLEMFNQNLTFCGDNVETDQDVSALGAAVADLTNNPPLPAFYAQNPMDILYVGSLAKIYPMYAAFELRKRVELHTKAMIKNGLSTSDAGWETKVYDELEKVWKPKLNATFQAPLPQGFPKLADIFVLSPDGSVNFSENNPPLTNVDLDNLGEFGTPKGKFKDWMRLMLRWSNNTAASNVILALSYPYINGVLSSAGFFDSKTGGLWISGDYQGHDWLPNDGAGQPLTPRWAILQHRTVSNFTGTTFQVARFMTLLGQHQLVDADSCDKMINMMTGSEGIGSYIYSALVTATPARPFSKVISKIGYGDDMFSHDCAIVTIERNGDTAKTICYVVVALGSPPEKNRSDLNKLVVGFHDCIVAQH